MNTHIIFNSYSGNTRKIAEEIRDACGGELTEVKSREYSSRLSAYTVGCFRAIKGKSDRIDPASIDVSGADLVVIGTPVWGGKCTPAINGAVGALSGCEGKHAVVFASCGDNPKESLDLLAMALEARGMKVVGRFSLNRKEIGDKNAVALFVSRVREAGGIL